MKMMIAQSDNSQAKIAVTELKNTLNASNIKAITFFASSIYEPNELIQAFNENFPNIDVFGCSTAGEIITGKISSNSIVAMAFTDAIFEDFKIEVIDNLTSNCDIMPAVKSFETYYSSPLSNLDYSKYFGLIYIDGLSKREEVLLDKLGDVTNVIFIGGSAGDDMKFQTTYIYANKKCYDNAAVLVLVKSKVPFAFKKIQSFTETGHKVVATKVDEAKRFVMEFDNRPAIEVYCEKLNIPISAADDNFLEYPIGLMIDGQPYVRSIRGLVDNSIIELYCSVKEGMELSILRTSNDIVEKTKIAMNNIMEEHKNISGMIVFNCKLRFLELRAKNRLDDYGQIFDKFPTIGFNTYGEAFIGHVNQTATILIFE